jgi:hypothetical protein
VDAGDVRLLDTVLHPADLGYVPCGTDTLTLVNESDEPARTILLGGPPFEDFPGGRLPAPALPNAVITPRRNPPPHH